MDKDGGGQEKPVAVSGIEKGRGTEEAEEDAQDGNLVRGDAGF